MLLRASIFCALCAFLIMLANLVTMCQFCASRCASGRLMRILIRCDNGEKTIRRKHDAGRIGEVSVCHWMIDGRVVVVGLRLTSLSLDAIS